MDKSGERNLRLFLRLYREIAGISQKYLATIISCGFAENLTAREVSLFEQGKLGDSKRVMVSALIVDWLCLMNMDSFAHLITSQRSRENSDGKIRSLTKPLRKCLNEIFLMNNRPSKKHLTMLSEIFSVSQNHLRHWFSIQRCNQRSTRKCIQDSTTPHGVISDNPSAFTSLTATLPLSTLPTIPVYTLASSTFHTLETASPWPASFTTSHATNANQGEMHEIAVPAVEPSCYPLPVLSVDIFPQLQYY
ncbi:uncharacterized protein LOC143449616 [Clavelina lepadiformis]|uniref:uncharacterized protein LOC143449616 n=1 Tax=Clavelina lepadiformis TaxID=159417 RepID=UPI004042DF8D